LCKDWIRNSCSNLASVPFPDPIVDYIYVMKVGL
jgi:hypothetical protein